MTDKDTNTVTVVPISVRCDLFVSTNNGASFFSAGTSCATQLLGNAYIVRIAVTNTGSYALQNVMLSGSAGLASCLPAPRNLARWP